MLQHCLPRLLTVSQQPSRGHISWATLTVWKSFDPPSTRITGTTGGDHRKTGTWIFTAHVDESDTTRAVKNDLMQAQILIHERHFVSNSSQDVWSQVHAHVNPKPETLITYAHPGYTLSCMQALQQGPAICIQRSPAVHLPWVCASV